jgi:hypothetical protein
MEPQPTNRREKTHGPASTYGPGRRPRRSSQTIQGRREKIGNFFLRPSGPDNCRHELHACRCNPAGMGGDDPCAKKKVSGHPRESAPGPQGRWGQPRGWQIATTARAGILSYRQGKGGKWAAFTRLKPERAAPKGGVRHRPWACRPNQEILAEDKEQVDTDPRASLRGAGG